MSAEYPNNRDNGFNNLHKSIEDKNREISYTDFWFNLDVRHKSLDMQIEEQLQELSPEELRRVIEEAQRALELKQKQKQEQAMRQIRELAAQAGLEVEIRVKPRSETKPSRRGTRLQPKYRHPTDRSLTWTGRGQMPRWLRELVAQGHDREEFRIHN